MPARAAGALACRPRWRGRREIRRRTRPALSALFAEGPAGVRPGGPSANGANPGPRLAPDAWVLRRNEPGLLLSAALSVTLTPSASFAAAVGVASRPSGPW